MAVQKNKMFSATIYLFFLKGKCVHSNEMKVNTSMCFNALAISEINSKCALNCILIDSIFIIKRRPEVFSAADPSVRHAVGHCDCCSWGEKNFPPLIVATSFSGQQTWPAHSSWNHLHYLPVTAALCERSGPPWKVRGHARPNPSLSAVRLIVRGAGDGGVPFWWAIGGEPFDSQHMAGRDGSMMRGQRQLVGVSRVDHKVGWRQ